MQRFLILLCAVLVGAGALLYLFRAPLKEALFARLTENMFVASDEDAFDPGPALGSDFPGFRAREDTFYKSAVKSIQAPLSMSVNLQTRCSIPISIVK